MRLRTMAAAAAAAATLLAVPATAHASAAPGPARTQAGGFGASPNWGGYVLHARSGQRFQEVQAAFTVPAMSCAHALRVPGSDPNYANAAFWAGLGGWGKGETLEQGGVMAECFTRTGSPVLHAFTEYVPGLHPSPDWLPLDRDINSADQSPGTAKPVQAGDHVWVTVADTDGTRAAAGQTYQVMIFDETTGMFGYRDYFFPGQPGVDSTAEVITEAPGGGPGGDLHVGFIRTGTVRYDNASAATWTGPELGINSSAQWRVDVVSLAFAAPGRFGAQLLYWPVQPGLLYGYTPPSPKGGAGAGKHQFDTYWTLPPWMT